MKLFRITTLLLIVFAIIACSSSRGHGEGSTEDNATSHKQLPQNPILPTPPDSYISSIDRASYVLNHVWDPYRTIDRTNFVDSASVEQFMVDLLGIAQMSSPKVYETSMTLLLKKSTPSFSKEIKEIVDRYLYNPNSPMRNNDLYAAFMNSVIASGKADFADSVRYADRLKMYERNKPGTKSLNFSFVTIKGKTMSLYDVKASNLLLFFYNPGCPSCEASEAYLKSSPVFAEATAKGLLTILFVYADNDLKEWREKAPSMPQPSIIAQNRDQSINNKQLYDLRAMPNIYLLDQNKVILLRDVTIDNAESYIKNSILSRH